MKFPPLVFLLVILGSSTLNAQQETAGVLIFQEPSSTFTEAVEYRSFHQDNVLFATVITSKGERKKMKAAAVIEAVAYPPVTLDPSFEDLAQMNLQKIEQLEARYPRVKSQLETARSKWERALTVFQENKVTSPVAVRAQRSAHEPDLSLPKGARLTGATSASATVTDATGVQTFGLNHLSAAQVLALNATSRTIQLPLGLHSSEQATSRAATSAPASDTTERIATFGRRVISFLAKRLSVGERTVSVWTFFVVLPALVLLLLIALIVVSRRGAPTVLPRRRPIP